VRLIEKNGVPALAIDKKSAVVKNFFCFSHTFSYMYLFKEVGKPVLDFQLLGRGILRNFINNLVINNF